MKLNGEKNAYSKTKNKENLKKEKIKVNYST
jgi:hypothetical protein